LRDAAARYAEVLAVEPGNAAALHYAGVVRYQSGDPVGAIDLIRRSIAVDQAPAEPWANLAQALDAMNRPEAAINALKEAARRAPLQPEIWSNLAAAESALGLYADAESSARKALAVDSTHAAAWHNLAMVLEPQGRLLEALDAASRAAALAPEAMAHAGYLAQLQEELGQLAAAAKTLDARTLAHRGRTAQPARPRAGAQRRSPWRGPRIRTRTARCAGRWPGAVAARVPAEAAM
jgi:tetratricopeptide (TPR) repeat protein